MIEIPTVDADKNFAPARDIGARPTLQWIEIARLRIDPRYQREVLKQGRKNVIRIASEFRWSRCSPLVVAQRADGTYAVIDGQHRAASAKLHGGIAEVPCLVIVCSEAEEAAAFATINGSVTSLKGLQIFHAQIAAGEKSAVALSQFCARNRVSVPRNSGAVLEIGQTLAIGTLKRCWSAYGEPALRLAISCVTKTGDGNAGLLNAPVLKGLCLALSKNPAWWKGRETAFLDVVERIGIAKTFASARRVQGVDGGGVHEHFERIFTRAVVRDAERLAA